MELRHLRYFVAVAEELNFHRAAKRLRLAQPSLGRQIRDLEAEVGAPLFERDRQHVALTDAGRVLLGEARGLLTSAEASLRAAREAARGKCGVLHVGNIGILSASFLPGSLAAFRQQYPRVDIEVRELMVDEQDAALLAGTIQIGFQTRIPREPIDARLSTKPVLRCGVSVVLPDAHPLAARSTLTLPALADEKLLNLRPAQGTNYERWVRSLCEEIGGFTPRLRQPTVDNVHGLIGLVAAGAGLAILPDTVLCDCHPREGWVRRPLRVPDVQFELDAVWRSDAPSKVLANYLALLSNQAPAVGRSVQKASAKKTRRVVDPLPRAVLD